MCKEPEKENYKKDNSELLINSIRFSGIFFGTLLFLLILLFSFFSTIFKGVDFNLMIAVLILFFGNLVIVATNHWLHWLHASERCDFKDFIYERFNDCFIRCLSGLTEMVFYTILFSIKLSSLVAGYLIFRVISSWKPKDGDNKAFGLSTAVLRTVSIFQILFSLAAAHFLYLFFLKFSTDFLNH